MLTLTMVKPILLGEESGGFLTGQVSSPAAGSNGEMGEGEGDSSKIMDIFQFQALGHIIRSLIVTGWSFGAMEVYDFPYIGNVIIPTDELIFFRGVETTNQVRMDS